MTQSLYIIFGEHKIHKWNTKIIDKLCRKHIGSFYKEKKSKKQQQNISASTNHKLGVISFSFQFNEGNKAVSNSL